MSDLTHSPVRLVSRNALVALKECYKITAEIKCSRATKTIALDLTNGFDSNKSFRDVSVAKNAGDWNENKEFTKDIFNTFKQFEKKYQEK